MKNLNEQERRERVVTFLNRKEVDFLDKLGKDALFSTGLKLSRVKLIAWLVDFMQKMNLYGEGLKSEKDFVNRVKEVLGKAELPGVSPSQPREDKRGHQQNDALAKKEEA